MKGEFEGANAAEVIQQIMEKENINQKELAERMGCVRQNVSQMLNRGTVSMRYDSVYKMAVALGYEIIFRKKQN
ncbi:MAG: helix-turn-helix transcriptional regulator [Lachnospiraceae bacterium]|nr:helix-turn-helix transcriptional regulator [Lachnospiraceae bacterium]